MAKKINDEQLMEHMLDVLHEFYQQNSSMYSII